VPSGTYKIAGHLQNAGNDLYRGCVARPATLLRLQHGEHSSGDGKRRNANGTPFIQMQAECTIKGITIFYPNQSKTAPVAYPWCIRGNGDNNSIIDVLLVNPWQAVDFGTNPCGRHHVRNLYGQALYRGIFVDNCFDVAG